jgi:two-component system, OmpR family, sensor kinase
VSLRLRLLVAVGLIAVVALVVADFATYSALRSSLYQQVDQGLDQHSPGVQRDVLSWLNNGAVSCSSPFGFPGGAPNQGPGSDSGGPANALGFSYIALTDQNGRVVQGSECPAYVGNRPYRPQLPDPIGGFSTQPDGSQVAYFTTESIASGGPAFRVRAEKVQVQAQGAGSSTADVLVEAQPLVDQNSTLHTLFLTELAVTAAAIVLALAGGWWLVRLGLRPLEDVERTADSIAAGNLDQRVPGADEATEVGRLARALNVMLERIQAAFAARVASESRLRENEQHLRQFVADASHELRTPIAAVSAYAELFERGGAEHADDLPRIAAGIRTETARMDRLVNDLLTLARLDEGLPMELAPVELVSVVSEAVRTATAVGPEWPLRFWASQPVEVVGDKDRLRQVMDNLLANVRAHTPAGTSATVRVADEDGQAEIEVRDSGPGMPADEARRIFERFYRVDPARARTRGGSGLGLSIVAAIVAAHDGTVSATSAPGEGMVITVRLPLASPPADPATADDAHGAGDTGHAGDADGPVSSSPLESSGPSGSPPSSDGAPAEPVESGDVPGPMRSPDQPVA